MKLWKHYYLAQNVDDVLTALSEAAGDARIIAGGTDLLLDLQQGRTAPLDTLVDVTDIDEMKAIDIRGDELFIGASAPLNKIVASPLVRSHAQGVVEACALIGGPQVRNTATLGGNVGHALPAADGTISLLAFDAQVEIASSEGRSKLPLRKMFLGPGKSSLDQRNEVLVGFYLPLRSHRTGSAFRRVMRPQGVAIAILNMAIWIKREGELIRDIRIAVGPGGPVPFCAQRTEVYLRGREFSDTLYLKGLEILLSEASFRTSRHRSTSHYREHVSGVLLCELLKVAWERTYQENA